MGLVKGKGGRLGSGAGSAREAADIAQNAGKTKGAAADLIVDGKTYTGVSGNVGKMHPKVQEALDNVPSSQREKWHGFCAEISCANQALEKHSSIRGGKSSAVNVGESGKGHGTVKKTCRSCRATLDQLGVKYDY